MSASLPAAGPSHGFERPTVDVANGPKEVQDLNWHQLVRHRCAGGALPS